jgi:hypothetical protein
MDCIRSSENGALSEQILSDAAAGHVLPDTTEKFHDYALKCARAMTREKALTKDQRELFQSAVRFPSPANAQPGADAADRILSEYHVEHPGWHGSDRQGSPDHLDKPLEPHEGTVMTYFDWYAFGFSRRYEVLEQTKSEADDRDNGLPGGPWPEAVKAVEQRVAEIGRHLSGGVLRFLARHARLDAIAWEIATTCKTDEDKVAAWKRWQEWTNGFHHAWWEDLPHEDAKVADFYSPLTTSVLEKAFCVVGGKHDQILAWLFERNAHKLMTTMMTRANRVLDTAEAAEAFLRMQQKLAPLRKVFKGEREIEIAYKSARAGKLLRITGFARADLKGGELVVRTAQGSRVNIEMMFTIDDAGPKLVAPKGRKGGPRPKSTRATRERRYKVNVRNAPTHLDVASAEDVILAAKRVEAEERAAARGEATAARAEKASYAFEKEFVEKKLIVPHWIGAFAYGAMVAMDIADLSDALAKGQPAIVSAGRLAGDIFSTTSVLGDAVAFTFKQPEIVGKAAAIAKIANIGSNGVEIFFNFYDGMQALKDADAKMKEGESVVGHLLEAKGVVLVMSSVEAGGVIAGELIAGTAATVAFAAAGPILAGAAIVVAALDVAVDVATHWSDAHGCMQPLADRLTNALRDEFGDRYVPAEDSYITADEDGELHLGSRTIQSMSNLASIVPTWLAVPHGGHVF